MNNRSTIPQRFIDIEEKLSRSLANISFSVPVTHVYNPVIYACRPHTQYVARYCTAPKKVLFLGMNPGPFGMAQTGVPFGEVDTVKSWLDITEPVDQPPNPHPKRPILGFSCTRSEVSGRRFWSLIRSLSIHPDTFFRHCFVHNYCPLIFMATSGKNVTPASLKASERRHLESVCDEALAATLTLLDVSVVVGVGKYAAECSQRVVDSWPTLRQNVRVATLMHPSPVNPKANAGWNDTAEEQLRQHRVLQWMTP